jgi:cardiolipin synthase
VPFSFSNLPNLISVLRIILTVPIIIALLNNNYFLALVLFLIAGLTDAIDGWIAKYFKLQSRLGSIIDPIADKLLLVGTFMTLSIVGLLPWWLFSIILIRDIIIILGTKYFYLQNQQQDVLLTPSNLSKINTILQIFLIIFLLVNQIYPAIDKWKTVIIISTMTATLLSGVDYIWIVLKKITSRQKH